ncbi:MAG: protein jag [Candidatus Saccharimonadales bacterium]
MEASIVYAKKYLEDLLSFFGLNTDVHATAEDDVIELQVPSTHLNGFLIGQRGDNMRSLQFLVSSALKNQGHQFTRVNVDIAEYKKQRAQRLAERAEEWVKEVKEVGKEMELRPMNAADRRTVHKLAADWGIVSESVGEGRDRRIVLKSSQEPVKNEEKLDSSLEG